MKIAYLVLCHLDPNHIARLVKKVTKGTTNMAFIHVDKKSDILPFLDAMGTWPQAHFLEKRTSVYWGGYSSVVATIDLMKTALSYGDFDRFVILQGLDYPIKSNREIADFFTENKTTEFIRAQNLSTDPSKKKIYKYYLFHFLDKKHLFPYNLLHKINSVFIKLGWIPHLKRNYVVDQHGRKMDIYQGCAHFGLTRDAVDYVVRFHEANPKFNKYFERVYAVDEAYFHTILYNSPFLSATVEGKSTTKPRLVDFMNLTYFEYPDNVTLFYQKSDYEMLQQTGYLFFRKASSKSKELLDYIDSVHASKE